MNTVLIIGGGAAGLMAGIAVAENGCKVTIFEKMRMPGKKMLITGKGRCNITNICELQELIANLPGNGRFLNSALRRFSNSDVIEFFNNHGLPTKVERGGRVFPVSDKAADVVETLVKVFKQAGGTLLTDSKVLGIILQDGKACGVKTVNGSFYGDKVILAAGGVVLLAVFFHYVPFFLWLSAKVSGVRISLVQLFLMRIRNVPPYVIVPAMIEAHKAGLSTITRDELEAHYMAGGHVEKVVHALVSASKANIDLSFQMATGIDLAGRDVFEAVQMSVNPKVIDTPPVTAVAKDGIQLIAKARVTVRANIRQLVGGAGEDTVLARVGEGIVSSIGSSENHKSVLENPDSISKLVLRKGLDAGTAFEILSIDIADIDIGRNIGASLQIDQANADKNIAQAKAEERRAMAVALEQEMKAKAEEARANVIQAEAEVPKAMAEAFRTGNLGIMDYYRMKNIQADTDMRSSIARPDANPAGHEPIGK